MALSVRVEAKDWQPLGSEIRWCRLEVRSASLRAGTSAGRSGFQKCPFVIAPPWPCLLPLSERHPLPQPSKRLCQSRVYLPLSGSATYPFLRLQP